MVGGVTSESEREIDLGGARAVPLDVLPKSDYIALGHLHKRQHMGKGHCYYSGSPLQYSFDEANGEKGVRENEAHWRQLTQIMASNPEVFEQFSGADEVEQDLIDNGYLVE